MASDYLQKEDKQPEVLAQAAEFPGIPALAGKFFRWIECGRFTGACGDRPKGFGLENLLAEMRVDLRVDAADMTRIPATGPVVVVANHPFGMLDGAVLAVLLTRVRPDVKVMTNYLLRDVPELARHCIFVNPFENGAAIRGGDDTNRRAVREALAWLQQRRDARRVSSGRSLALAISAGGDRRPAVE